ncbi:MAG: hypothetical protein ABR541_06715 [Candidatus Dormibacteria bacterium]
MSDEFPRPTQGRTPDRHPDSTPPSWWADLGRPDLPEPSPPRRLSDLMRAERSADEAEPVRRQPREWRSFAVGLAVIVVAVLIGIVALGNASLRGIEVAGLVLGVPALLATGVVLLITRRSDES